MNPNNSADSIYFNNGDKVDSQDYEPTLPSEIQITLLLISGTALMGNLIVCSAILSKVKLRKTIVNCFVISLCFTQIFVDVIVIPMFCFANRHFLYGYAVALTVIAYITNLLALTIDRYIAVIYPLRYRGLMWYSRSVKIVIACWIVSFVVECLPVLWHKHDSPLMHRIYLSFIVLVFLFIPLCVVVFAYVAILREIRKLRVKDRKRHDSFHGFHSSISENEEDVPLKISVKKHSIEEKRTPMKKISFDEKRNSYSSPGHKLSFSMMHPPSQFFSRMSISRTTRIALAQHRQEIKSAVLFLFVGLMYSLTWIPVLIMTTFRIFGVDVLVPDEISIASMFIMAFTSLIDSMIYGLCMKDIRNQVKRGILGIINKLCKSSSKEK